MKCDNKEDVICTIGYPRHEKSYKGITHQSDQNKGISDCFYLKAGEATYARSAARSIMLILRSERMLVLLLMLVVVIGLSACGQKQAEPFAKWAPDAPAMEVLTAYVQQVTDKKSPDYIPPADRIAAFDLDGTLMCELFPAYFEWLMFTERVLDDSTYDAPEDVRQEAYRVLEAIEAGNLFPDDMERTEAIMGARAFAGMTTVQYADYVRAFKNTPAVGFENLKRGDAFYQPMLEVITYLQGNGFIVYIVSGTDRFAVRTLIDGVINIPQRQVIGMDVSLVASGQGARDGLDYLYTKSDVMQRGDELLVKNVKMNKVSVLEQELGQQPVLVFGNSSGDASMMTYTIANNPYKSHAFLVVNDDTKREYGNPEKSEKMKETAKQQGWTVISMRDDFKTIYGEQVTKVPAP